MTLKRDLIGLGLAAWTTLLVHLNLVQLTLVTDIFWWNLHENGKFSIDSMYKALIITRKFGR
jgi:hypothetical protein